MSLEAHNTAPADALASSLPGSHQPSWRSLASGLCPGFSGSDSGFLLSGRWEALWPKPQPLRARRPSSAASPQPSLGGSRGAGAVPGEGPAVLGEAEPFQAGNSFLVCWVLR